MPVAACPSPSHFLPSSFEFINRHRATSHELAQLIRHPGHLLATFASLLKFQVHHIDINAIFDSSTMDDDTLNHLLVTAANPDIASRIVRVGVTYQTSWISGRLDIWLPLPLFWLFDCNFRYRLMVSLCISCLSLHSLTEHPHGPWPVALFFEAWISQIPRSPTPCLPWSATHRRTWVLSDVLLCSAFTTPSKPLKPQIPVTASCLLISCLQLAESSYSVMSLRESGEWGPGPAGHDGCYAFINTLLL